jgi:2-keto-4-pentenoate hydratase/2-oxohepta-3-ene-1,7-dioic acid hydratase in catechol pathway
MKFCRFQYEGRSRYGLVEPITGVDTITHLLNTPPHETGSKDVTATRIPAVPFAGARLLAPVSPTKIVCVGRNYREHAIELGHEIPKEPLLFFKPLSSLLAPGENIRRPAVSQRTDYEGELGVVVGRTAYKLGPNDDVRPYILGYTAVNDFTARDLQNKDGQWTRAKGFDTFCPVGPMVTDEIDPWTGVTVETRVNGAVRQHGTTLDFLFPLDLVIRYITSVMTLFPGDLIATGTPPGVGPVVAGDTVDVTVQGVGNLSNPIVNE